jgi:hypothetical protein
MRIMFRGASRVKMKDEVLIVNGMTRKIVDMFPEKQPLS